MIEMLYHLQLNTALGPLTTFMKVPLDASGSASWVAAAAVLVLGLGSFEWARRRFALLWGSTEEEIEATIKQREGR